MSDKEISVEVKTKADVKGINQAKKELEQLTNEVEENTKAIIDNTNAHNAQSQAQEQSSKDNEKEASSLSEVNEALQNVAESGEKAGEGGEKGAKGMKNLGYGMLQVAQFADDAQYGLRGVMNNIPTLVMSLGGSMGLAGALSVAVLGFSKLYDWMTKSEQEAEALAKQQRESAQKIIQAANELEEQMNNDSVIKKETDYTERLLGALEKEVELLKAATKERKRQLDHEKKLIELNAKTVEHRIEARFHQGGFGDPTTKEAQRKYEAAIQRVRSQSVAEQRQKDFDEALAEQKSALEQYNTANAHSRTAYTRASRHDKSPILSADERTLLSGEIENEKKAIIEEIVHMGKLTRTAEERSGFFSLGRISSDDMRRWATVLVENGLDVSRIKGSFLQENPGPLSDDKTPQEIMAKALEMSGIGNQRYKKWAEKVSKVKASDNALVDRGFYLDDEKKIGEVYKKYETEVIQADKEAAKKAVEAEEKAKANLADANDRVEKLRAINEAMAKEEEARRIANEAEVAAEIEREAEAAKQKAEIERLKKEIDDIKKAQKDHGESLETAESRYDDRLSDPLRVYKKSWGVGTRNKLRDIGKTLSNDVKRYMEDGIVDNDELTELTRAFQAEAERTGQYFKGGQTAIMEYLRKNMNSLMALANAVQAGQAEMDKLKKDEATLSAQVKNIQSRARNSR